ncbi:MAG: MFS transporter [Thermoplasmata archaeon]|nr:MFS transporter [Thermoplasmata archaeon]
MHPVEGRSENGFLGTLANRRFRNLFGSAVGSAFGSAVSSVAVNWLVWRATHSPLDIAYVGLAGVVPGIALGFLAGVLADRYNRRQVMVLSDLARAAAMAVLALYLLGRGFDLAVILGVMVVVNIFGALFTPASFAIVPRLVDPASLETANGLLSAAVQFALSLGAAAGGLTVTIAGASLGIGVNAATFGLSAFFILQIAAELGRAAADGSPKRRATLRAEFIEGLRYMRQHPPILAVTIAFFPANFLLTLAASFLVVYAGTYYPSSSIEIGYLVAAFGIGIAVGSLVVTRLRAGPFAGVLMGSVVLTDGVFFLGMALFHELPVALALILAVGVGVGLINVVYYATMQAIVPNEILARVLSIDSVGSFGAIPGGLVVGGLLTNFRGIGFTFEVAAVGCLAIGLVMLAWPAFRAFRRVS